MTSMRHLLAHLRDPIRSHSRSGNYDDCLDSYNNLEEWLKLEESLASVEVRGVFLWAAISWSWALLQLNR